MIDIELDIPNLNGKAEGLATARTGEGHTIHADTGNWYSDRKRSMFCAAVAAKVHPEPEPADGESEAAFAARREALRRSREAAVAEVKELLLDQIDKWAGEGAKPRAAPVKPATGPAAPAEGEFALTDTGNAERLMDRHHDKLKFVARWNKPIIYLRTHWTVDETGAAHRLAIETMRDLKRQAVELSERAAAEEDTAAVAYAVKLFKHAVTCESAKRLRDMLDMAAKVKHASIMPDALDVNPWLLNVLNGTLDLETGKLRPHNRDDLITKICPVEYDPAAGCPTFLAFMDRIFGGNAKLIAFMQRVAGYSLTGLTGERCLFVLYGCGANGKSTWLAVMRHILGPYTTQTPVGTLLTKKHGDGIPNDIARLKGARVVSASESDEGRRLSEALVKQMTGGEDMLTGRFMFAEFFDFKPEFKLFLATNHKPEVRGTDPAIWDRIHLIPFGVVIPKAERDPLLSDKLRAEAAGILRWCVEGCAEWRRLGLSPPEEVRAATKNYREEMDRLGDFIDQSCVVAEGFTVPAGTLYSAYKAWCQSNGEEAVSQHRFGRQLSERGLDNSRRDNFGRKLWRGLGLRSSEPSEPFEPFSG